MAGRSHPAQPRSPTVTRVPPRITDP